MKRIHLFEFEDQSWFPHWLRACLTRLIVVVHRMVDSEKVLVDVLKKIIQKSGEKAIIDLCSGSGGPMIGVVDKLNEDQSIGDLTLTLTDLYPNKTLAAILHHKSEAVTYLEEPVNATQLEAAPKGIKTMICSFHHMPHEEARSILQSVCTTRQVFCLYEISDNSYPLWLSWITFPINILMCLFITPFVRPLTFQQILFTYLIPIIPITFAWDGAVSNVRTYTLSDMNKLLDGISCSDYNWNLQTINEKGKKLVLTGEPV